MRKGLVLLGLLGAATFPGSAAADPGAADLTFGRGGVVLSGSSGTFGVWATAHARTMVGRDFDDDALLHDVLILDAAGRPIGRFNRRDMVVGVDGRGRAVVVANDYYAPRFASIRRRTPTGGLDRTFGSGGYVTLPGVAVVYGLVQVAVALDGRVAIAQRFFPDRASLTMLDAQGVPDLLFGTRTYPADGISAITFDSSGRLLVATEAVGRPGVLHRLLANGSDDPAFASPDLGGRIDHIIAGPSDAPFAVLYVTGLGTTNDAAIVDPDGSVPTLPRPVRDALIAPQYQVYPMAVDAEGRIVLSDGQRVLRVTENDPRVEVLRRRPPGGVVGGFGVSVQSLAIDGQGRIVLGGHRHLSAGIDPTLWRGREDVVAVTRSVVVRLEGGVRRVAIVNHRLGAHVTVACLPAAQGRCVGSLSLIHAGRRRHIALDLRPGARRTFAVPLRVRRGAKAVRAVARIHDATGELSTARRTLTAST
ncbi:MAG: hypothetical protein JWO74_2903 [Solirubrobacterales bacterium]|nr:hypothetical protein [Solirubrobacterales bacterium]